MRGWIVTWVVGMMVMLGARPAAAHDVQSGYLELRQTDATHVAVLWKVPAKSTLATALHVQFPAACRVVSGPTPTPSADSIVERSILEFPPAGLEGQSIAVEGLATTLADVLVRVVRLDGTVTVARLNPAMTSFVVASRPGLWQQAATYTRLGTEHILMGVDHLLFVLGLLLIVKDRWMLLKTVSAFTLAHSITLAVATLGFVSAPLPPLNAAIALSILFLGPEIVRARRGQTSFTLEHPWVVAFAFGLLHGFGFASGLTTLGLSGAEIPLALLLFNVGVEIGQLVFVVAILALEKSFQTLEVRWPLWVRWVPAYAVGGLGAFWTIQRGLVLLGAIS